MNDVFVPSDLVLPKGENFKSVANQVLRPSRLFIGNSSLTSSLEFDRLGRRMLGRYDEIH